MISLLSDSASAQRTSEGIFIIKELAHECESSISQDGVMNILCWSGSICYAYCRINPKKKAAHQNSWNLLSEYIIALEQAIKYLSLLL